MIPITWILKGKKALSVFASPLAWVALFAVATVVLWFLWRAAVADLRAEEQACELRAAQARMAALQEAEEVRRFVTGAQQEALGDLATRLAIATRAADHWYRRYEEAKKEAESPCATQAALVLQCPLSDDDT